MGLFSHHHDKHDEHKHHEGGHQQGPGGPQGGPPADSRDRVALNTAVLEDPRAALVASADLRVDSRDSSRVVLVASAALEDPRVDTAVTAAATADPVVLVVLREATVDVKLSSVDVIGG
ncbi:uncharacterized protein N7487_006767 [Penicillium crustosum]|uniref:uncharacterized protein n=1 Tax=Penicillium crustosum TaxID=36656 RepID=UPI00238B8CE1|nr:uncharacterized protein N7487_006767 [Penicillium crustosum]KAJ5412408.1 hypothetical protein N7487_006767 [Penicillium crustosum]